MIKCANCDKEAAYTKADHGANPIDYCVDCLPSWLRERALLGHFPLKELPKEDKKEDKKASKKEPSDESN